MAAAGAGGRLMVTDLRRFVLAQADTYATVVSELRAGAKQTHWMWFVFPQVAGLGASPTAGKFAISSLAEAQTYVRHPVLGPRLLECAGILTELPDRTATQILGPTDAMKLRSSMTLFAHAAPEIAVFRQVLERYYDGVEDEATTRLI